MEDAGVEAGSDTAAGGPVDPSAGIDIKMGGRKIHIGGADLGHVTVDLLLEGGYGEGEINDYDLFVYRAARDGFVVFEGRFKRNCIHVRDVARAFQHCMGNFEAVAGRSYHVGPGEANLSRCAGPYGSARPALCSW